MKLSDFDNIYFIGIGGIGVSAIARYFLEMGKIVSGSDKSSSKITELLKTAGADIFIGSNKANIPENIDLCIYTIAVQDSDEELKECIDRRIKCITYPEALGILTSEHETICVAGTHGKTTTTAMMAHALKALGESSTVIVGSLLADSGTNYIKGVSKYLVVESCEYKRSFMNLHPSHAIVTNIDADHLDYYKDLDDIKNAFNDFASLVPASGYVVSHGIDLKTNATKISPRSGLVDRIKLNIPGAHNRQNASLCVALLEKLGFGEDEVINALADFRGTWRRFEYKGKGLNGALIYDDYGHHPTELLATFQALNESYVSNGYKTCVYFQPHLFSRTKEHFDEFVSALSRIDRVKIAPIYGAREIDDGSISSHDLVKALTDIGVDATTIDLSNIRRDMDNLGEDYVAMTIGAGDIYKYAEN